MGEKKHERSESAELSKEEEDLLDLIVREGEGIIREIDVREGQPRDVKLETPVAHDL